MAKRKPQRRRPASSSNSVSVRRGTDGKSWILVHPREVRDRAEDLEEVAAMIDAGELDIALDELRWLLSDCAECIAAHVMLGDLAKEMGDTPLARGHYGTGYQLGLQALRREKMPKPLLYSQPANQPFFLAGRGLVWSLEKLGKPKLAEEVITALNDLDPSDPLTLKTMLDEMRSGGAPVISLSPDFPT